MRTLLLLPLLLVSVSSGQNAAVADESSAVVVLGFKWSKTRQKVKRAEVATTAPAAAMTQANRNFERNQRPIGQAGVTDPNADTLDGRRAAMEKIVQESRTPNTEPLDGFAYQVKVQNASTKVIEVLFWEYQFKESSNPANVVRRQFLCGVKIKPGKEKEMQAFSLSGPSNIISVESLANKSGNLFQENVVINRVEYADGSIWQRQDWNFAEVRIAIERAIGTPWKPAEMCRGL